MHFACCRSLFRLLIRKEMKMNQVNFEECPCEGFSEETRNYAASSLVDALLASCETQEERIELSVNLLGYDPRCEH